MLRDHQFLLSLYSVFVFFIDRLICPDDLTHFMKKDEATKLIRRVAEESGKIDKKSLEIWVVSNIFLP